MGDHHVITHLSPYCVVLQRPLTPPGDAATKALQGLRECRMTHRTTVDDVLCLCGTSPEDEDAVRILGVPVSAWRLLGALEAGGIALRYQESDEPLLALVGVVQLDGTPTVVIEDGGARICVAALAEAPADTPELAVTPIARSALSVVRGGRG